MLDKLLYLTALLLTSYSLYSTADKVSRVLNDAQYNTRYITTPRESLVHATTSFTLALVTYDHPSVAPIELRLILAGGFALLSLYHTLTAVVVDKTSFAPIRIPAVIAILTVVGAIIALESEYVDEQALYWIWLAVTVSLVSAITVSFILVSVRKQPKQKPT